jgi:quinolinate synthase
VYINTSLRTKAETHARVPTITCTSSNVVRTILQAAAQIPDVTVWYGPDTYMGRNLETLFHGLVELGDDAIRAVHPAHDRASLAAFLPRFQHFRKGVCVVHHMFGADVADRVRRDYPDAYVTAHLEVPGEMFALGWDGQRRGRGVVGSTSDILAFIHRRVQETGTTAGTEPLRFVLATEAGMITSIVKDVREAFGMRKAAGASTPEVEIIFPVASEAIARTDDPELALVPGVATGEGCSVAGGCATCPYMKMSSLDATFDLLERIGAVEGAVLAPYHPKEYAERIDGRTTAEVGGQPILHMRHFQKTGELSPALVDDVVSRNAPGARV